MLRAQFNVSPLRLLIIFVEESNNGRKISIPSFVVIEEGRIEEDNAEQDNERHGLSKRGAVKQIHLPLLFTAKFRLPLTCETKGADEQDKNRVNHGSELLSFLAAN